MCPHTGGGSGAHTAIYVCPHTTAICVFVQEEDLARSRADLQAEKDDLAQVCVCVYPGS
jgi:hypothetical protein